MKLRRRRWVDWSPWDRTADRMARMMCWVWGHSPLPLTVQCVYCGKDLR